MEREKKETNILYHTSHLHPLKLTELHGEEPKKPVCYACRLPCTGSALGCSRCSCFLHPLCARLPRTLRHSSHPSHPLTLRLSPAYPNGEYLCNACGGRGQAFCFHCPDCQFDLHLPCAAVLPGELNHHSHPSHALTLVHENPYKGKGFVCDLCRKLVPSWQWIYLCRPCEFGGHVDCFIPEKSMEKSLTSGGGSGSQPPLQAADPMASLVQMQQSLQGSMVAAEMAVLAGGSIAAITAAEPINPSLHYGGGNEWPANAPPLPFHDTGRWINAMLMQQVQQMALLGLHNSIHAGDGACRAGASGSGGVTGAGGGGGGRNEGSSKPE